MPPTNRNSTLFVYGALLDRRRRIRLLGREVEVCTAVLRGYLRGRGRHFFIVRRAGAVTRGAILSGLDARDFRILDEYEEVPRLYTRERIEVTDEGGNLVRCWIYLPAAQACARRGKRARPPRR